MSKMISGFGRPIEISYDYDITSGKRLLLPIGQIYPQLVRYATV